MRPVHAPYAGSAIPFTIGLRPLEPARWLEPDADRDGDLAAKHKLIATRPEVVIRSTPETWASEADMLARIAAHLARDHGITIPSIPLADEPPLVTAARHVQDDLVLMRRSGEGWRLAAACLCFPASWSLAEKFSQPMDAIHANVPGWAGQMATRVARIFDNLQDDEPVWRLNWSIDDGYEPHRPMPKGGPRSWRDRPDAVAGLAHVRVERQTLLKSSSTGDILFTIRTYIDPLGAFADHPDGAVLASALSEQLAALTESQLAYKGIKADREALLRALAPLAGRR